jgi:hypothetical protein
MTRKGRSFSPDLHRRQTQNRLILGGFLLLVGIGGGLVWLLYGQSAAITAVACLFGAAGLFGVVWVILTLLELWVRDEGR